MLNLKIQKDQILNKVVEIDINLGTTIVLQKALELAQEYLKMTDNEDPNNLIVKLASIEDNGNNKSMVISKGEFSGIIGAMRDDMNLVLTNKVVLDPTGNGDDMYIEFNNISGEFKEITKDEMVDKIGIDIILVVEPETVE